MPDPAAAPVPVRILRVISSEQLVVQVVETNAVVAVRIDPGIPLVYMPSARLASPFKPLEARVHFGTYDAARFCFDGSRIDHISWPPPAKYNRRANWLEWLVAGGDAK